MTIVDIKALINAEQNTNITHLLMVNQKEEVGGVEVPSDWFSHWDNAHRIRVVMHRDVLDAIKADPAKNDLVVKLQLVAATTVRAAYKRYVVVVPAEVEAVF